MKTLKSILFLCAVCVAITGCQSMSKQPLETVDYVDIERFMGDWYVIAHVPTFIDDNAYNAVESYSLNQDGTIATTFRFREGGFDGKLKTYYPKGFITDTDTNAVWGMQFVWPIKADYRIVHLAENYEQTIIGRTKRDYVWIMARTPQIPAEDYQAMMQQISEMGYDISEVKKIPQRWPEKTDSQ
jgi:apolipoprotein D and lipocalin family protein